MRVTHLNTNDIKGGASKAAYRLHQALKSCNIHSNMLVKNKQSNELGIYPAVFKALNDSTLSPALSSYLQKKPGPFSAGDKGLDVSNGILINNSDIIQFHWINGDFLSLDSIKKIGELRKPIVWTLHDMWAFTGGCHYSDFCDLYEKTCEYCPFLHSEEKYDLANRIWERKRQIYHDLNLAIVTCSSWLADCAKKSTLFRNRQIEVIPNTIDLNVYKPIAKNLARKILNLPAEKYLILFGAVNAINDQRKGYDYLQEALRILNEIIPEYQEKIELLVFGASHIDPANLFPYKINLMGTLADDYTLALCYNAANIFVAPSLQDNLPNTIMESLACGTPVMAFNTGGIPDLIEHHKNGYLAEYKSSLSLAEGIRSILENNQNNEMGVNARNHVKKLYSKEVVANQYIRLYEELTRRTQKRKQLPDIQLSDKVLFVDDESIRNSVYQSEPLMHKKLSYDSFKNIIDNGCGRYETIVCSNILRSFDDIVTIVTLFNKMLFMSGVLMCGWDLSGVYPDYYIRIIIEKVLFCLGFYKMNDDGLGCRFVKQKESTEADVVAAMDKVALSQRLSRHLFTNDGIMTEDFIKLLSDDSGKIAIFGAGEFGKKGFELIKLFSLNITVECFFDNESVKWGKTFCDLLVQSPELKLLNRFDKIIIGSVYGRVQIEKQLLDLGLDRSKIVNIYGI